MPAPPAADAPTQKAPDVPVAEKVETARVFQAQLRTLYEAYLTLQGALASDNRNKAVSAAKAALGALDGVDMKLLEGGGHMTWMKHRGNLSKAIGEMTDAKNIEGIRAGFALMSEELPAVIRTFGLDIDRPIYVLKCPMAFDGRGARWLQDTRETRNPYFGAVMLRCGEVVETLQTGTSHGTGEH